MARMIEPGWHHATLYKVEKGIVSRTGSSVYTRHSFNINGFVAYALGVTRHQNPRAVAMGKSTNNKIKAVFGDVGGIGQVLIGYNVNNDTEYMVVKGFRK